MNDQEKFWQGEFGDQYIERNKGAPKNAPQLAFFSEILGHSRNVESILEFGANIGLNLSALQQLAPQAELTAVEINEKAAQTLHSNMPDVEVHATSIADFNSSKVWDLVFTKGVLIHINPEQLPNVYDAMYKYSSAYILIAEYYSRQPSEVSYRGHEGKLFKRDFAGEMLDRHPDLSLVTYGFAYHRDNNFPQDDLNWFLLRKTL